MSGPFSRLRAVAESVRRPESGVCPRRHDDALTANVGQIDRLRGLKENVTIGRLIPASTHLPRSRHTSLRQGYGGAGRGTEAGSPCACFLTHLDTAQSIRLLNLGGTGRDIDEAA